MKVLVTGCSGFIGQHVVQRLLEAGFSVMGIDIIRSSIQHSRFTFDYCDILNRENLLKVIEKGKPNLIAHLAARTDLNETNDLKAYRVNFDGVANLIEVIKQVSDIKRCIFTSTQLVHQVGSIPKHSDDFSPHTLYGLSKVHGEKIVKELDGGQIEWCIVRPTTIWGPGMSQHYQRFMKMIRHGLFFHIDNLPLYKSYGYVGNITHQYQMLLQAPYDDIQGKTFYLADYEPLSLRDWANALQREMNAQPIRTLPHWLANLTAKAGDMINRMGFTRFPFNSFRLRNTLTEYRFDMTATEAVCGPLSYDMNYGVQKTVRWLLESNIIRPVPQSQT